VIDALFGTEIEFASAGDLPPARAAELVKNVIFAERRFGIVDPAPREWDEEPGNGGFLFNGARLYIDSGHIEYATAECRTLDDIVGQENAASAVLLDTVERQELNRRLFFIKNNTDYLGNAFGYHENYTVRRSPRNRDMVTGLMPFLVTRQLYAGAGMILQPDESDGGVPFHISQRAKFVTVDVSNRVRFGGRPIINLRDEPLSDEQAMRRLHVIVGDANRCEYATALKIGSTALVAQLLETGWDPDIYLEAPVRAIKQISANPGGPWSVEVLDRGTMGAIDVQRHYLAAAEAAFAQRDEDTDWTLDAWRECLDALESDPERLIGKVDWLTKLHQLREFASSAADGWADPDLVKVDLAYHHIDPTVSLFAELERRGIVEKRLAAPPNPLAAPIGTRAMARGRVVRALADAAADDLIDWKDIHHHLGSLANWENQLFLVYQYIEDWRELEAYGGWDFIPYLIDWTGIGVKGEVFEMSDPFKTYLEPAEEFSRNVARYLGR
jgi:hypothetical protein